MHLSIGDLGDMLAVERDNEAISALLVSDDHFVVLTEWLSLRNVHADKVTTPSDVLVGLGKLRSGGLGSCHFGSLSGTGSRSLRRAWGILTQVIAMGFLRSLCNISCCLWRPSPNGKK